MVEVEEVEKVEEVEEMERWSARGLKKMRSRAFKGKRSCKVESGERLTEK